MLRGARQAVRPVQPERTGWSVGESEKDGADRKNEPMPSPETRAIPRRMAVVAIFYITQWGTAAGRSNSAKRVLARI